VATKLIHETHATVYFGLFIQRCQKNCPGPPFLPLKGPLIYLWGQGSFARALAKVRDLACKRFSEEDPSLLPIASRRICVLPTPQRTNADIRSATLDCTSCIAYVFWYILQPNRIKCIPLMKYFFYITGSSGPWYFISRR
jgi:hypothetical protein